jgi:hypothetical protein
MFRKSAEGIECGTTMDMVFPTGRWGVTGHGLGRDVCRICPEVQAMREVFVSTLSQVVELGIFAAAAGALAVGMMHVR